MVTFLFLQCTSLTPTPCFQQRCRNTEPGFQCLACPLGYVGTYEDALSFNISRRTFQLYNTVLDPTQSQTCSDINECLSDNGGCDANAFCTNTPVSLRERERVLIYKDLYNHTDKIFGFKMVFSSTTF